MQIPLVDLKRQYRAIKPEIDEAISKVISDTAFVGGKYVKSFEEKFASFCGARHCIGVGNGTDALFLALKALSVGPGDEVVVPANSFIATSEAVTMTGARVAFVDIDPKTHNMDPNKLEDLLKARVTRGATRNLSLPKAVIPVHLYGRPADMDTILVIARRYGLRVVEDAAQAHGASYKGRPVGTLGDLACFSFYPGKNLGAYGDGGAVVTDQADLATRVRMLADHGRVDKYNHEVEGVNSRLDGLQAAILEVKLRHLPEWSDLRRRNAALYREFLQGTDLKTPVETDDGRPVYHLYVVRVNPAEREALQGHLSSMGVATGIHYPIALPRLKAYEYLGHTDGEFQEAERASHEILSLPMFPELEEEEIAYVASAVEAFHRR